MTDYELPPEFDRDVFYSYLYKLKDYDGNYSEEFSEAWDFIDKLEFDKALNIFEDLAEKGDVFSQTNTGGMYESYPPLKNIEKSKFWYKKSIEKGSDKSRAYLGNMYLDDESFEEAYKLLSISAANKDVHGCGNLARMYANGYFVERDINKAIELVSFSAKNTPEDDIEPGLPYAFLGELYMQIDEIEKAKGAFIAAGRRQPSLALQNFEKYATERTESRLSDFVHGGYSATASEATHFYSEIAEIWESIAKIKNSEEVQAINGQLSEYHWQREGELEGLMRRNRQAKAGGCFIATSVYGDFDSPEVRKLRAFRDEFLLKSKFGRSFVKIYYKYSPKAAYFIDKHPSLKTPIKNILLNPFVRFLSKPNI